MTEPRKTNNLVIEQINRRKYDELEEIDKNKVYVVEEANASETVRGLVKVDGETITATDGVISATVKEKPYTSLVRNAEYLYTITFDELPEANGDAPIAGACTSFVKDGKLYRNLDWNYDENVSFKVITKDFEGMAFIDGLTADALDNDKLAQLPYRVSDGVNKNGIMVSTHVLYNDWGWVGTGDTPLTRLPYYVLTHVKSMDTIATDLADVLADLNVPEAMAALDYLIQVVVTDGTITYVIMPPEGISGAFVLQDITANPKLTNFRWVANETVVRTNLQDRPTGVERWNLVGENTTLEDLRFTVAYEQTSRLSEFIGIDGTDKDSTDAELTEIYNVAHLLYLDRERNGQTWQTMHSVVYGNKGMEHLYVQEDWGKDFVYATRDELYDALDEKVDKIAGKQLSTEDYTTAEKTKLAGLENYDDTEVKEDIADLELGKQDILTAGDNITIENNVISAEGGDALLIKDWTRRAPGTLPDEYQKVQYIESQNSAYVLTDYFVQSADILSMKFEITSWTSDDAMFFAACDGNNNRIGAFRQYGSLYANAYNTKYVNTGDKSQNVPAARDTVYDITIDLPAVTWTVNNDVTNLRSTFSPINSSLAILARRYESGSSVYNIANGKLYSFKIVRNGSLIMEMIPCYHKINGTVGLYDTVGDIFYTASGTGQFIKGPDAN